MSEHFPCPGALLLDDKGDRGRRLFGILLSNNGHTMRVFWGDGRKSNIYKWQLEERLIHILEP